MPTRSCVVCRKKNEKNNLLRIVSEDDKKAILDTKQKINKRAIYFCNDKKCYEKFIKLVQKRKLDLKYDIDVNSVKEILENIIH